jgi:hypothetical protein
VVAAATMVPIAGFVLHAAWGLRTFLRSPKYRAMGSRPLMQTPLPLLLRVLYLLAAAFTFLGDLAVLLGVWARAPVWILQEDPVRPVDIWSHLDTEGRLCMIEAKYSPVNYVAVKFCTYLFFFIKQRTVRQMEPKMGRLEKLVLQNTFSMIALMGIAGWLIQANSSPLDGTCVLDVPVYLLVFMLAADCVLSSLYLYLFLQPLRETIALNARRTRSMTAATGPSTAGAKGAVVTSTTVIVVAPSSVRVAPAPTSLPASAGAAPSASSDPHHLSIDQQPISGHSNPRDLSPHPSSASSPTAAAYSGGGGSGGAGSHAFTQAFEHGVASAAAVQASLALERVMRRNALACACAIASGTFNLVWFVLGMTTDQPHVRKLVNPFACIDTVVIMATLCWVLHGKGAKKEDAATAATGTAAAGAAQQQHGVVTASNTSTEHSAQPSAHHQPPHSPPQCYATQRHADGAAGKDPSRPAGAGAGGDGGAAVTNIIGGGGATAASSANDHDADAVVRIRGDDALLHTPDEEAS